MPDFLETMGAASRSRVPRIRDLPPLTTAPRPVPLHMTSPGFDVIAEAKLAGPVSGPLVPTGGDGASVVAGLVGEFERAGAIAVSVLTEPSVFDGDLDHLRAAVLATRLPVMRKDFLVDSRQVEEARAYGVSGVLLIARMLSRSQLIEMTDLTLTLGMFALVELFSVEDLDTATAVFDRDVIVGVNSRDLSALEVNPDRFETLRRLIPDTLVSVAESGLASRDDVARIADLGYRLALIGTGLLTAAAPGETLRLMIASGRGTPARRTQ